MLIVSQGLSQHPTIPGWKLAHLSLARLARKAAPESLIGLQINRETGERMCRRLEEKLLELPQRTLVGLDLSGISTMDINIWALIGPRLAERLVRGELGPEKRLEYLVGESYWLLNDLQWSFERDINTSTGKAGNRAALAPKAARGFVGLLAPIYADALNLITTEGYMDSVELYGRLVRRYSIQPSHADQCLSALAQLGLIYRRNFSRPGTHYELNAGGHVLSVPEEAFVI